MNSCQAAQSSSAKGSSIEIIGCSLTNLLMNLTNCDDVKSAPIVCRLYFPFSKNSVDAMSKAILTSEPTFSPISLIHEVTNSQAASIDGKGIPSPPSSAIRCVAPYFLPLITASSRIATIQESASVKLVAPCGRTKTS